MHFYLTYTTILIVFIFGAAGLTLAAYLVIRAPLVQRSIPMDDDDCDVEIDPALTAFSTPPEGTWTHPSADPALFTDEWRRYSADNGPCR